MKTRHNCASSLGLLLLFFVGCLASACAKSSHKEAAQPAVEATPSDEARDQGIAPAAVPPVSPSPKKQEQDHGSLDADAEGEATLAAEKKESGAESPATQAGPAESLKALHAQTDAFDIFLAPGELSCGSARPHLDAICSIAERLCRPAPDSLHRDEDCKSATQSCQNAKKRFQAKCE